MIADAGAPGNGVTLPIFFDRCFGQRQRATAENASRGCKLPLPGHAKKTVLFRSTVFFWLSVGRLPEPGARVGGVPCIVGVGLDAADKTCFRRIRSPVPAREGQQGNEQSGPVANWHRGRIVFAGASATAAICAGYRCLLCGHPLFLRWYPPPNAGFRRFLRRHPPPFAAVTVLRRLPSLSVPASAAFCGGYRFAPASVAFCAGIRRLLRWLSLCAGTLRFLRWHPPFFAPASAAFCGGCRFASASVPLLHNRIYRL